MYGFPHVVKQLYYSSKCSTHSPPYHPAHAAQKMRIGFSFVVSSNNDSEKRKENSNETRTEDGEPDLCASICGLEREVAGGGEIEEGHGEGASDVAQ
jgi:hypothetical protein